MVQQVEDDFIDETPVFIGVLAPLWWFLILTIYQTLQVSFIKMASYEGTSSTNEVKQLIGLNQDLTGRSVILEDIVDTGNTLVELKELFKAQNVKHFKIATLSLNRKRTKGHQD
jgi:hypoxanthine phosphoribosyltransferase